MKADLSLRIFNEPNWPDPDFSTENFLVNAISMSLMSDEGYWFDALNKSGEKVGSRFSDLEREPLTENSIDDHIHAALDSLSWLKDSGFINDIAITGNIEQEQIKLDLSVEIPGQNFNFRFLPLEGIYAK